MKAPLLANMTDTEIEGYIDEIDPLNYPDACLQVRMYCEHVQRQARGRHDLCPDARIMIENLAKLSKAIADVGLISNLDIPEA